MSCAPETDPDFHASEYTGKHYRYSALAISTGCPSHMHHPLQMQKHSISRRKDHARPCRKASDRDLARRLSHQPPAAPGVLPTNYLFTQRYNCCILPVCTIHAPCNKQNPKTEHSAYCKKPVINLPHASLSRLSDKNADAIQHCSISTITSRRYP